MKLSNAFLIVGSELEEFLASRSYVSKNSYSTYLKRCGISPKAQQEYKLKYHYDRQTKLGSVYFPLHSFCEHKLTSFFKLDDSGKVEYFEANESDLKQVYSSINCFDKDSPKTIFIISFDFTDFVLLNASLSSLGLINVIPLFLPAHDTDSLKVVHEQLSDRKVLLFNPDDLTSTDTFIDDAKIQMNIKSLYELNRNTASNHLVKPLLKAIKALND